MQFLNSIFSIMLRPFTPRTPAQMQADQLAEAERSLVVALHDQDRAKASVDMFKARVARLRRELNDATKR